MTKQERIQNIVSWILRNKRMKTEGEIAELIGYSKSSFSQITKGKTKATDKFVSLLCSADDQINLQWALYGVGEMISDSSDPILRKVPLLSIHAASRGLSLLTDKDLELCERIISPVHEAEWAIRITDNSLMPDFRPGDIALLQKINERAFIEWGKIFALDTCNGMLIKRLQPSQDANYIVCESMQPNAIAPINVHRMDIKGYYRVVMMVRPL